MVSDIVQGMAVDLPSRHRKTPTSRSLLIAWGGCLVFACENWRLSGEMNRDDSDRSDRIGRRTADQPDPAVWEDCHARGAPDSSFQTDLGHDAPDTHVPLDRDHRRGLGDR